MPTFCRADKKPASSPVASSGSAYTGAATPIMMPTLSAASSVLITHPSFFSMERCPSAQLRIRRHNLGLNAFGQVHRVDAGGLRELFEQTVETVLVHGVVLH